MSNARYIPTKEAAVMISQALKAAFPTIKFSVKTYSYSGGSHVSIEYTDGPTAKRVEAITDHFCGRGFDGMTASVYRNFSNEKAKTVPCEYLGE